MSRTCSGTSSLAPAYPPFLHCFLFTCLPGTVLAVGGCKAGECGDSRAAAAVTATAADCTRHAVQIGMNTAGMSVLNFMALFIILGIGADDIFIFVGMWHTGR